MNRKNIIRGLIIVIDDNTRRLDLHDFEREILLELLRKELI